jgi:hypothetical protein
MLYRLDVARLMSETPLSSADIAFGAALRGEAAGAHPSRRPALSFHEASRFACDLRIYVIFRK